MEKALALRRVESEILDGLAPDDPAAVASRRDLARLNRLMRHVPMLVDRLTRLVEAEKRPLRLAEIGAGDGSFMLSVARRLRHRFKTVDLTLVDRAALMTEKRREAFESIGWRVQSVIGDVFDWIETQGNSAYDVTTANLFLHHFADEDLSRLLGAISRTSRIFVALEPRRSPRALAASRLVWLIGANRVTRHDAPASVRAGFSGDDLSTAWPTGCQVLEDSAAGIFSHAFAARGKGASR